MKTIELVPGIHSSALGFGCASALGSVDGKATLRAMATAFDLGVTHFDIARSYGYGEAEHLLGQFALGKRERLVIATKFGIEATMVAHALRPLKSAVRAIMRRRKRSAGVASIAHIAPHDLTTRNRIADVLHRRLPLTPEQLTHSLETSLKALRTDYVDFLFIHEPAEALTSTDDLLEAVEVLKRQGKVRAWGLAFLFSQWQLHQRYLSSFDVLQFDNSPCAAHYQEAIVLRRDRPNIFFSPFRHALNSTLQPSLHSPQQVLRRLTLDFPQSVILCSMSKEEHIRQNADVFS